MPVRVSFQVQNLDTAATRMLVGSDGILVQHVARALRAIANRAKILAPVDYGVLRNSHYTEPPKVSGHKVLGYVGNSAYYASYVHDGTQPHVIRPRNARVLAWGGDPPTVFARVVHHPGTAPRPWLANAARMEGARLGFTDT